MACVKQTSRAGRLIPALTPIKIFDKILQKEAITMTKFIVVRENSIEERKGLTEWTAQDMHDAYWRKSDRYEDEVGRFDSLEEAEKCFEEEAKICRSYYTDGQIGELVLFDWLGLEEAEVDEDGEFLWADIIDEYVAPIGD